MVALSFIVVYSIVKRIDLYLKQSGIMSRLSKGVSEKIEDFLQEFVDAFSVMLAIYASMK